MFCRRVLYLLALCAALLFQITNDNYLAHLLLGLVLALPLLSLALSLPSMLTCRLSLSADPGSLRRGERGGWRLWVECPTGLPLARLSVRLETASRFTGERERRNVTLYGRAQGWVQRPADTSHCGLLELSCGKARVWDCLGLFSRRVPLPEPARLLVGPVPQDPGPVRIPESPAAHPRRTQTGAGSAGEDYDLREYRPGDPLRRVHWKLSSKWDELIVREPLEDVTPLPLLVFDHFGAPGELDEVLDRLTGLSRALLAVQRPHAILWLDPDHASPCRREVTCEKDLRDCLLAVLSQPCPATGPSIADRPELLGGGGAVLRVCAGEQEGDGHES